MCGGLNKIQFAMDALCSLALTGKLESLRARGDPGGLSISDEIVEMDPIMVQPGIDKRSRNNVTGEEIVTISRCRHLLAIALIMGRIR